MLLQVAPAVISDALHTLHAVIPLSSGSRSILLIQQPFPPAAVVCWWRVRQPLFPHPPSSFHKSLRTEDRRHGLPVVESLGKEIRRKFFNCALSHFGLDSSKHLNSILIGIWLLSYLCSLAGVTHCSLNPRLNFDDLDPQNEQNIAACMFVARSSTCQKAVSRKGVPTLVY